MRRAALPALLLCALMPSLVAPTGLPAQAATGFCSLTGMTTYVWDGDTDGDGDGFAWTDPYNWRDHKAPDINDQQTGYACIDDRNGGVVSMVAGEEARLQAVEVAAGTTLRLLKGSKLFVYGDQASRPSRIHADGRVTQVAATLGGTGRIELDGTLTWRSETSGPATITSRRCVAFEDTCDGSEPEVPGRMVVGDTGVVMVDRRGVNLYDRYSLVVRGRLILAARTSAYIAADRDTSIALRPQSDGTGAGILDVRNDGGIYEGFARGVAGLPDLVNDGVVLKRSGAGVSAFSVDYTRTGSGRVVVRSGGLTLGAGSAGAARVAAGRTYGSGTCAEQQVSCDPTTTVTDDQLGTFRVPSTDTSGAAVKVRELARRAAGDIGVPVFAHADGLDATRKKPAVISLRYDAAILAGKRWRDVSVFRQSKPGAPWVRLPACRAAGSPPSGSVACVDRRGLALSSRNVPNATGAPDVLMVVRTVRTSRWVAR